MKKINSILSLLAMVLCFDHFICMSLLMLGKIQWHEGITMTGIIVFVYLILHGIYGMYVGIRNEVKNRAAGGNKYVKPNQSYYRQMDSGIVTLILSVIHVLTISSFSRRTNLIGVVVLILFTVFVCAHMVIGFPRALMSLGLMKKEHHFRVYWWIGFVLCSLLAVFTIVSSLIYYRGGGFA